MRQKLFAVFQQSRHSSVEQVVSQDAPECGESVLPGNLFALRVGAAGIGDGNFVDSPASLRDLGGEFRLEAKAIGLEFDILQNFAAKNLVARLHVAELQVGENVGEQCKELVSGVMPKIMDALRAAQES